jgi:hypothetical protein
MRTPTVASHGIRSFFITSSDRGNDIGLMSKIRKILFEVMKVTGETKVDWEEDAPEESASGVEDNNAEEDEIMLGLANRVILSLENQL